MECIKCEELKLEYEIVHSSGGSITNAPYVFTDEQNRVHWHFNSHRQLVYKCSNNHWCLMKYERECEKCDYGKEYSIEYLRTEGEQNEINPNIFF